MTPRGQGRGMRSRERKVPGKRTTTKALPLSNGVIPNTLRKKIHLKISYALGNGNFYHFNSTMGEFPSVDSPPSPSSFLHTPYFPSFFPPVVTRKTPLPPLFPAVFFCSLLRSPPPPPFFHRAECFTPACIFNKVGLNAPSRPLPRLSCFCGNVPSLVLQDAV